MAAKAKTFATTGSTQVYNASTGGGPITFNGLSVSAAGALTVVRVWDNTSAAGELLAVVSIAANTDVQYTFPRPVVALVGVRVEVVTGTATGSVYLS